VRSFGVNQSNINGTKLKTYPLPLPALEEQQQIVQEIESRLSVCDKIEETITYGPKTSRGFKTKHFKERV
jgi:type I restriction enzyme, S subunit